MRLISIDNLQQSPGLLKQCGGKGQSLFKLSNLGYTVPDFLIIPSGDITAWLAPLADDIEHWLAPLHTASHHEILNAANQLSTVIQAHPITANQQHTIEQFCQQQFGTSCVSIRSSALAEDGEHHSFAGQLDSFLYVQPVALIEHIKSCVASLYSARAIKYRLAHGLPYQDEMAVIIQRMVTAEKSGVLFTMNTAGNLNESAIVAAYGTGEGVVSDRADSDMFYIERHSQRLTSVIQPKTIRLDINHHQPLGTIENTVATALQNQAVLSNDEITAIASQGWQLEVQLGRAQDIEFAIDQHGKLFFLQARPITTIDATQVKILDNSNIIESYPGITLPLSIDFAKRAYQGVFTSAAHAFKLSPNFIEAHAKQFSELLIRVNGRVYYQLHNARSIMEAVLVSERSQQGWRNFLGLKGLEWPIIKPSYWRQGLSLFRLLNLLCHHPKNMANLFRLFHEQYSKSQQFIKHLEHSSSADIFQFYQNSCDTLFKAWAPTIINDYFAMKAHELYLSRLAALGLDTHENLANDLLCGIVGMESEEPLMRLLSMKEIIQQSSYLQQLFDQPANDVWLSLSDHKINHELDTSSLQAKRELMRLWDDYIEKFSDRTLEELKLETPTLKMRPELLVSMLQNQLANTATLHSFKTRQRHILKQAEAIVTKRLKTAKHHKWLFYFFLKKTRLAIKDRENMRINRARIYGVVKTLFLELGKRMHQDTLLERPEDVFYLRLDDLKAYANGDKTCKKQSVLNERQAIQCYQNMEMPDRLIYQGQLPDLSYYHITPISSSSERLKGIGVSKGEIQATARVVHSPSMDLKINGEILVTRMTDPGWVFLMSQAAGIISEKGSLLSHTAIIGREFGIPTIVGVEQVTQHITNGNFLALNADLGEITILDSTTNSQAADTQATDKGIY